ncbi:CCR4-NOT transcription complex subunit 3-like isoform X2 [Phoenix dactylifera]|uniref:CCR4-NOT transcription complex subunit 3-like isoform X2 n=1 Tax=Phoenix dactylifera TaxID=42345 RepID=A0A8B9B0X1_PHODC|nr:CCR4-NOT transcription complex subunit 3-like isoform X2 [Phoenix dactylifera]
MGASRKLQGEIDRVLKKVQEGVEVFDSIWNKVYDTENANQKEKFEADLKKEIKKLQRYRDQIKTWIQSSEIKDKKALMDARKLIEREMERFKVCEKETKTKAFSKEGLGQQPKTDPKEKAKSETRDWLNNVVGDLESQIDNFEAEVEGLSVKKGKTRPPRLTHLEMSITRHRAHIIKLELILRLLDNDELSPDQVNDVRDFLEDYVERNQEDFDEFSDVDELYSTLPLDKVEALEDLVSLGPSSLVKVISIYWLLSSTYWLLSSSLVKGVSSVSVASAALGSKNSAASSPTQAALSSTASQNTAQDQSEETASQDSNSDIAPRTPPSKSGAMGSLVSAASPSVSSGTPAGPTSTVASNVSGRPLTGGPTVAAILSGPPSARGVTDNSSAATSASITNSSSSVKEDDSMMFPGHRSSPAIPETGIGRGISRGISNQVPITAPMSLSSASAASGNGALGSVPAVSDLAKRNMLNVGSGNLSQPLVSPLSNRILLHQASKTNDGTNSNDSNSVSEGAVVGGRVFSPSVSGVQWRPPTATFQSQNETGQFRGRPEIAPDQREKFLLRLQQVQQQGHSPLLGGPHIPGANDRQLSAQQQSVLLQQLNSQSSSISPQVGLGLGVQGPGLASVSSASQQQATPILQQSSPHPLISTGSKDGDAGHLKVEDQNLQNLSEDLNIETATSSAFNKTVNDEELKTPYMGAGSSSLTEGNQLPRDTDLSPGQPLQPSQSSASLGVIGRRSVSDLGAIGDNLGGSAGNSGGMHDQIYNMQMLEAAFYKLPQPKDSERVKSYVPRHPAVTPPSYPQTQAPIIDNPAFWERLGFDPIGTDTLFFAFYYQQNTYQQYLAARELKRQSWRYHKKYNTWFQRHEEPKVTNDEYEKGTYVYFDFHIADDGSQHGWCQRIKTEFTFEYNYLEDELVV